MQVSDISVAQSPAAQVLPGAAAGQGSAASWQAALNAAQTPDEQGGQSQDAASQDTQSESEPAAQAQQALAEPATNSVAVHAVQGQAVPAKGQNDKAAGTTTVQDDTAAAAKHAQQRSDIIAAAASVQVEAQAKPQDKAREKEQNGAVAASAVQQAQPEQMAATPKAPMQAGGPSLSEAVKSAAPSVKEVASDTPAAEAAAPESTGDAKTASAPSGSRTVHAASGQPQQGAAETFQLAATAPATAPVPVTQQPVQSVTAKTPDVAASKVTKTSEVTGNVAVGAQLNKSGAPPPQTVQTTSAGDDNDKTPSVQSGFVAPVVHAAVNTQTIAASNTSVDAAVSNAALPVSTNASAAGLAATITAMHQSGQGGATFRLDPPGLGALAVHVALGQQGQVNVLFVPSTQAGGAALQSGLPGLGQALAQSGLTLGQAQVGGQSGQNAGQGGQQPQARQGGTAGTFTAAEPAAQATQSGVSAYA